MARTSENKVCQVFSRHIHAIYCFFVVYLSLIIFSIPIFLMIVYRAVLSIFLKVFYRGRFQLMSYDEAPYTHNEYASPLTITYFAQIRGPCDIDKLRQRFATNFLQTDKNGKRPYAKLLMAGVQKFGFSCWEDKSNSIDFSEHVRLCPGADDENRIYSESEVLDAVAILADNAWDEDKPRWEFLVTPKVQLNGTEVCSIITLRMHHVYVDGISFVQVLRNCGCDQPPPKLVFDPVNPPIPPIPCYKKVLFYIQVFFMGPYSCLRLMGNTAEHVFFEGDLTGGKLIGKIKMNVSLEMMRGIRKKYNTSTQAILHSAFTSALQNMAVKKGYTIPDEIIGGIVYARFPYPDEYPRNNAMFGYEPMPMGITNPPLRLAAVDKAVKTLNGRQYALLSSLLLLWIIGLFPSKIIKSMMKGLGASYFISNVPGIEGIVNFQGNVVENIFGFGPICYGIRYHAGVGYYNKKFTISFLVEKGKVIGCREELEDFICEFENELKYFQAHV